MKDSDIPHDADHPLSSGAAAALRGKAREKSERENPA